MENNPLNSPYIPGGQAPELRGLGRAHDTTGPNFRDLLGRVGSDDSKESIRFSSNAQQKLERAGVELSSADKARLGNGFKALEYKGVKDGLVVIDDKRFVVSVSNKTVITMMTSRDREVFTNIEGVAFE